ncbi:MAG TPA: recombinase family protein [Firmicutes bacterium]|nr:recombinase family protein [Bacillota bacterium]
MNPTSYGYIRVSTKEQHEDRQLIALREFPVREDRIYMDKLSGKNFDRPQYRKLIRRLSPGDVLVIKAIDRLGRNYDDIQEQWRIITKEIRADIVVLDMPLLDTRKKGRDLTGTFISDMVLQILSYVAQIERENIRSRQAEGIAAAKAKGIRFGRSRKEIPDQFTGLYRSYREGSISARAAARLPGISHSTFLRWGNAGDGAEKERTDSGL